MLVCCGVHCLAMLYSPFILSGDAVVSVSDFVHYLKENNLVIVHVGEIEAKNEMKRHQLLKKKAITPAQIVDAEFFSFKNTKTIHDWIASGRIKQTEWFKKENNHVMILTSAVKRLTQ